MTRCRTEPRVIAIVILAAVAWLAAAPAWSQTTPRLRVTRRAPIMMDPRGDSLVLGTANPGDELEIIAVQPGWYGVVTPEGMRRPRGWIPASAVQVLTPLPGAPRTTATGAAEVSPKPIGRLMVRAFAAAAGVRFAANDTFDTILGTPLAGALGAGAEVVLPNGTFMRGSVDRFRRPARSCSSPAPRSSLSTLPTSSA